MCRNTNGQAPTLQLNETGGLCDFKSLNSNFYVCGFFVYRLFCQVYLIPVFYCHEKDSIDSNLYAIRSFF